MRALICAALVALALPAAASAAGFDGTYSGASGEGQQVTVVITGGKLKSISGAAVRKLTCFRDDPSKPFPNDRVQLPDRTGEFAIDPTVRSNLANSQFLVGTPSQVPPGDHVENSAEGRFHTTDASKPFITLTLFYKEISDSGSGGARTDCSGGSDATLERSGGAGSAGTAVAPEPPRKPPRKPKAARPPPAPTRAHRGAHPGEKA